MEHSSGHINQEEEEEEEEAEIPMPISSFVGVHGHGHHGIMSHHRHPHHHHHHHHQPHHHDPSSSSSHNQQHNIIPSNNSNGVTSTTTATIMEEGHYHHHHNHQLHCNINDHSNGNGNNNNDDGDGDGDDDDDHDMGTKKKNMIIRYRECQKNHAASMGGNATDGCGEFMPNGEEGTLESLTCSACNCHRNFHRKEIQGGHSQFYPSTPLPHLLGNRGRKVFLGSGGVGYPTRSGPLVPFSRSVTISMPPYPLSDQSDDHHHHQHGNGGGMMMVRPHSHHHQDLNQVVKKRFRTKFSQEQKEKMFEFAEKVGWKIQKQEEAVVQQFCQQVGIKRRVLKVWMHNNKHNLAKKNNIIIDNNIINSNSDPLN